MMKNKLEKITSNLKLSTYTFNNNVFIVNKQASSTFVLKCLIEVTSQLDDENIEYSIDAQYNIHILNNH